MKAAYFLVVATAMIAGLVFGGSTLAQTTFVEITPQSDDLFVTPANEDFWLNAAAPADVDGDGDLDLAVMGFYVVYGVSATDRLVLFINEGPAPNGEWTFSRQEVDLQGMYSGPTDLAWGDYDGDGDPDLAVGSAGETAIFNNGAGVLSRTTIALPGYLEDSNYNGAYDLRSLTWADFDNDGDLDLLIPSSFDMNTGQYSTKLMRNDQLNESGEWIFTDTAAAIDPTLHGQSSWADDDGDGDLDLFLVHVDNAFGDGWIRRFENSPSGFSGTDLLDIKVDYGTADWGDFDADDDMDVLVAGSIQEADGSYATALRIYHNQNGSMVPETLAFDDFTFWLDLHAATWADYDSDGDFDILLTGNHVANGEIVGKSDIYENTAEGFAPMGLNLPAPVDSAGRGGAFLWFDIDNDGDLDYFVGGAYYVPNGNGLVEAQMHLYRNDSANSNFAPLPPSNIVAVTNDDTVTFDWAPAIDDSTPENVITYDLEIQSLGAPNPLRHRLAEPGNIGDATHWQIRNLPPGQYSWLVRSVDNAYDGSDPVLGQFTIQAPAVASVSAHAVRPNNRSGPGGGIIKYQIDIHNFSTETQTLEYRVETTHGDTTYASHGPWSVTLNPDQHHIEDLRQGVLRTWPSGVYTQRVIISLPGQPPMATAEFQFRKLPKWPGR